MALQASSINLPAGGFQGVLIEGENIVWRCPHWHANAFKQAFLPHGHDIKRYPEKRSARGCASVELSRREKEGQSK